MPRIFCGNFDFEHELGAPRSSRESPRQLVRRIGAALAPAWLGIAAPDDVILTDEPIEPAALAETAAGLPLPRFIADEASFPRGPEWELVPWGWTPSMAELARRQGWSCTPPSLDVVRQVNSREFRFALESQLDVALPGSALARSIDDLHAIVAQHGDIPNGWILKSNFGMAGRESIRGRGTSLSESLRNWAAARIAQVGCVVFEPLVEPLDEAGLQLEIPAQGEPVLVGVTPLLVDRSGTYRGSRFGSDTDAAPWRPAVEIALRVARILQGRGYFGPLGIDAMRYRDPTGEPRLRPLQDLNARHTMGRLALGFHRLLPPAWCATWLHLKGNAHSLPLNKGESEGVFLPLTVPPLPLKKGEPEGVGSPCAAPRNPVSQEPAPNLPPQSPTNYRLIPTSPHTTEPSAHSSVLVLASDVDTRTEVERAILSRTTPSMRSDR